MATEKGIVSKVGPSSAWVTTQKTSACKSCSARKSCHTLGGGKEMSVEAVNAVGAKAGDRVLISFKTASLIKASFLIYIFPIVCLILGAVIGKELDPLLKHMSESSASAITGFSFLIVSFILIRLAGNQLAKKNAYRPKIIKIIKHRPAPTNPATGEAALEEIHEAKA